MTEQEYIKEQQKGRNVDLFLAGMSDAKQGKPHKEGSHADYTAGYESQYTLEEINSFFGAK